MKLVTIQDWRLLLEVLNQSSAGKEHSVMEAGYACLIDRLDIVHHWHEMGSVIHSSQHVNKSV